MRWFVFETKDVISADTKYRSVVGTYYDWQKNVTTPIRWLEYKIIRTELIIFLGFTIRNKETEVWCKVKKPMFHPIIAGYVKGKEEFGRVNLPEFFISELDGDFGEFIKQWPDMNRYYNAYYWEEVEKIVQSEKEKSEKEKASLIINLN